VSFAASALATPLLRLVDGESAHHLAVFAAAHGLLPRERRPDFPALQARARCGGPARMHRRSPPAPSQVTLWGRVFPNPLGLAAGFDKDAEGVEGLLGLGFGFVEVGSVTPQPQEGNPRPRVFRLPDQRAVINRYGFNSQGLAAAEANLLARRKQARPSAGLRTGVGSYRNSRAASPQLMLASVSSGAEPCAPRGLVGVNLGKNKSTVDAASDYEAGVAALARFADYLVVNVSSPNTPGLRSLQGRAELDALLRRVQAARAAVDYGGAQPPPLVLKIAPDLTQADLKDIAAVALARRLDGIIVSNTTLARPPAVACLPHGQEAGGLSGAPLFEPSTRVLRELYALTRGRIPLIGAGGVSSGHEAYQKLRAGASLVQLYTAFAYEGPPLVRRVKAELADCLAADGFACAAEAVGADHRAAASKKGARRGWFS